MLRFVCEYCKGSVRVREAHAGRNGRCPHCQRIVTIPGERRPEADDNVSALVAALGGDEPEEDAAAPPPPTTAREPDIDEFDLVTIEAVAEFETDRYPAIRPEDDDAPEPVGAPPKPFVKHIPSTRITWQNVLLVLVSLLALAGITAMIIWTHFCQ